MISLRGLECLVAVIDMDSVTKAAAMLQMSESALLLQIARIEGEVGVPVIERLPQGVRPTTAGLAAVEQARIAIAAADRAVAAARSGKLGTDGRIRIVCPEAMTAWLLTPVFRAWRRQSPGVEIDVRECARTDQMLDTFLADGADIALLADSTDGAAFASPAKKNHYVELIGAEEIVAVAPRGHRFAGMNAVPVAELRDEPLVHYHPGNGNAAWIDEFTMRHGVLLPPPVLRTGSSRTAAQLAAEGLGVAVVPISALTPRPRATIRSFDPPGLRNVLVVTARPSGDLVARFVCDLKKSCRPAPRTANALTFPVGPGISPFR